MKLARWTGFGLAGIVLALAFLWAVGALYFDGPSRVLALFCLVAVPGAVIALRPWRLKFAVPGLIVGLVLGWWFSLRPTNEADWQPDVSRLARAEIQGDVVTLHNVRHCDYRTETEYTPRWETRSVRLSQITGVDIAVNYWGSPWMAHPIVSFQFADAPPVCFSIETRKKIGQSYSAIGGLYRQFALIYIVADERDVIRVRTNFRKGEDVYLFRTTATPEQARERFLEYLHTLNRLHDSPRWYNAVTTNCTTTIRDQHPARERPPWDWRILVNGKGDELMYERRTISSDGLPFAELKRRAHINPAAMAAGDSPGFSQMIRDGRPGFGGTVSGGGGR